MLEVILHCGDRPSHVATPLSHKYVLSQFRNFDVFDYSWNLILLKYKTIKIEHAFNVYVSHDYEDIPFPPEWLEHPPLSLSFSTFSDFSY